MKPFTQGQFEFISERALTMQYGKTFRPDKTVFSELSGDIKLAQFSESVLQLNTQGVKTTLDMKLGFRCHCRQFSEMNENPFCYHTFIHALKLFDRIGVDRIEEMKLFEDEFMRIGFRELQYHDIDPENYHKGNRIFHILIDSSILFFAPRGYYDSEVEPMVTVQLKENGFRLHCNCGDDHSDDNVCQTVVECFEYMFYHKIQKHFENQLTLNAMLSREIGEQFGLQVTEENFKDFSIEITPNGLEITANIDGLISDSEIMDLIEDRAAIVTAKKIERIKSEIPWAFLLQLEGSASKQMVLNLAELDDEQKYRKQTSAYFIPEIDMVVQEMIGRFNSPREPEYQRLIILKNIIQHQPFILLNAEGRISKKNVFSRKVYRGGYNFCFKLSQNSQFYILKLEVETELSISKSVRIHQKAIIDTGEFVIIPNSESDYMLLQMLSATGEGLIPKESFKELGIQFLLKLLQAYKVYTDDPELSITIHQGELDFRVNLRPVGKTAITVETQVLLNGVVVKEPVKGAYVGKGTDKNKTVITVVPVQLAAEFSGMIDETLRKKQTDGHTAPANLFHIDQAEAFKDLWLGEMVQKMKIMGYQVTGMEQFKNIEFNEKEAVVEKSIYDEIDWFGIKVNVYYGENMVSINALIQAIKKGHRTIKLADGTLGVISDELIDQVTELTSRATMDKDGVLRAPKSNVLFIEELALASGNQELLKQVRDRIHIIESYASRKPTPLPKSIKAELRHYQVEGFEYLQTMEGLGLGAVLGDDMGLGKTLQSIVTLEHLKAKYGKEFKGALIICPVTLISNWENEFTVFSPKSKIVKYYGKDRSSVKLPFGDSDIVITSLQTFRQDTKVFIDKEWQVIIVDEAQNIKNPKAKTTVAVNELKARWRLALTGTPIENSALDAFSIFSFANPGILGTIQGFNEYYNVPINKGDSEKGAHLKRILAPLMLRRSKKKVLPDLPMKTESVVYCTMGKEQRDYYEAYRVSVIEDVERMRKEGSAKFEVGTRIITGILALRQICNHPMLAPSKMEGADTIPSVKLEVLREQLQELIPKHKALIFSNFTEYLAIVRTELNRAGISNVTLTGGMKLKDRDTSIKAFKDSKQSISTFLITTKAGGAGLNLTEADYVFIVDPWWNPASESQAIDRTHRIGQKNPVMAFKYICKDTVEDKILQLQRKKRHIFDTILDDGGVEEIRKKLDMADLELLLQ